MLHNSCNSLYKTVYKEDKSIRVKQGIFPTAEFDGAKGNFVTHRIWNGAVRCVDFDLIIKSKYYPEGSIRFTGTIGPESWIDTRSYFVKEGNDLTKFEFELVKSEEIPRTGPCNMVVYGPNGEVYKQNRSSL